MSEKVTRRTLLKGAAAGSVGLLILRDSRMVFAADANDKLNMAIVGCGGRGGGNLGGVSSQNIVALLRHGMTTSLRKKGKEFRMRSGSPISA